MQAAASNCKSRDREYDPQLGHMTFMEIDQDIISIFGHSPHSAESRRAVVSY